MPRIAIQEEDFDLQVEYDRIRQARGGAIVVFTGLVRDFNHPGVGQEEPIEALYLEHYPGMTERLLQEVVTEAEARWSILDITVIHRVGTLGPGDQIVLVAVSASHRHEAFVAAQFVMDYLKTRATFWKKTISQAGSFWLDMKESDQLAVRRWSPKDGDDE